MSAFARKAFACLIVLAMLAGGSAAAGEHVNPAKVRAALKRRFTTGSSSPSAVKAAATNTSPLVAFSMKGIGTNTDISDLMDVTCS
ncbi:MAG TPA: hypothetical protein VMT64_08645, partial [Candidatus Binataceae bacterium]|nr:hypothetical protein [Candidatus Binataceae bacterium]